MSRGSQANFDEELARARLAFISAGQQPLGEPRRAAERIETDSSRNDAAEVGKAELPAASHPTSRARARLTDRFSITTRQGIAILLLLLCGVGVTLMALGRSSANQVAIEAVPSVLPLEVSAPPEPSPVPSLHVHVLGAVVAPGVVTMRQGSIVQDAVLAAGGLRQDADPAELNLAAPLSDGQQVIVGTTATPRGEVNDRPGAMSPGQPGAPINLNTATATQLEELPGVGPVLASAIVAWRDEHGQFTSVAELQEVSGIGPRSFAKLEAMVTT